MKILLFLFLVPALTLKLYAQDTTAICCPKNSSNISIYLGISNPTGSFSSITEGDSGSAKIGYTFGLEYAFKNPLKGNILGQPQMSFLLSLSMSINQYNVAGLGFNSTHENGAGYWTTIWG